MKCRRSQDRTRKMIYRRQLFAGENEWVSWIRSIEIRAETICIEYFALLSIETDILVILPRIIKIGLELSVRFESVRIFGIILFKRHNEPRYSHFLECIAFAEIDGANTA